MRPSIGQRWNVLPNGPLNCVERRFFMTRLFLVAGVAALAISAPASAKPGGNGGHGGGHASANVARGGGHASAQARGGGHASLQGANGGGAFRVQSHGGGHASQARSVDRSRVSAQRQNRPA